MSSETDLGIPGISDAEVIGQGGFSVVYAATDTRFARRVAVKVLGKLISESDRRRFDRECQVMGQLSSHPNVVTVFSGGYAANDHPYLIMELVEGGTLADRLDTGGPIPWREAIDYVIPVADALGTGHRRQPAILHRDVKPENILLAGDHAKLTDFGIAYLRDATGATSTHITASWLHTPPETFENERDARSDIYSLVSTLFTLIAGDPPFWRHDDESLSPLMRRLMIEPAPPLDPALGPPELRDLLRRGLAKDPGERPQTATELIEELRRLQQVPGPSPTGAGAAPAATPVTSLSQPPTPGPRPDIAATGQHPSGDPTVAVAPADSATGAATVTGGEADDDEDEDEAEVLAATGALTRPADGGSLLVTGAPSRSSQGGRWVGRAALRVVAVGAVALFAWIIADYRGDGSDGDGTGNAAAGENVSEGAEDGADSGGDGAATTGDCGRGKVICVGLVTGQGSIEDGAFNQAAWEGLQQVELDTGAVVEYWESYDPADVQTGIERFIGDGFDIVVTVGFLAADITAQTAVDYPDVYFIGVEQRHDDASTNLVGLVFPEDQAGYLAGAIAGRVTRTGVVGQVLGPEEVEPIRAFGTGFENGVASVDPGHQVLSTHHPGPLDVGFVDPDFGAEVVAAYHHHDGVDVVFAAAGMTGDGALTEMALEAESGEDVWCIGVDVDQWETLPEAQPCLVTSAVKNITDGLVTIVLDWDAGEAPSGTYLGDVSLAEFRDFYGIIPDEAHDQLTDLAHQLASGEVDTGY